MTDFPSSAYIHFPFCARKCFYCDFPSYAGRLGDVERYVRALKREIRQAGSLFSAGRSPAPLQTVYVGGGTPTLAGAERLTGLLADLRTVFPLADNAEVTLEANPGTVAGADFERLRTGGFNRISFGLQAWQDALLLRLGRIHTTADFIEAFTSAREAGFDNLSVDIMLGPPGTAKSLLVELLAERVAPRGGRGAHRHESRGRPLARSRAVLLPCSWRRRMPTGRIAEAGALALPIKVTGPSSSTRTGATP